MNVLLPNGGKWVGLILQLKAAMQKLPQFSASKLIVADRDSVTPSGCFADETAVLPPIAGAEFINRLLEVCLEREVGFILPTMDLVLDRIAPYKYRFMEHGINVICPDLEIVELCQDKKLFERFAHEEGLAQPVTYGIDELDDADYPLFHKPRRGYGSIGIGVCNSRDETLRVLKENSDTIFQEYINAPEITVDAYVSVRGVCTVCIPRQRDKVVGGESYMSHTFRSAAVKELSLRTINALARRGLSGPLIVQMFLRDGQALLTEVNTRIGSATLLSNMACNGRLYESILIEASGGIAEGDPDDYIDAMRLYRFLGDVFHIGDEIIGVMPDGQGK